MIKDGPFPACLYDLKNSIRWLRANAKKYNVDPDRIGAYGNSAGGTLVLIAAMTAAAKELEGDGTFPDSSSELQAVVCSGAVGDMQHPNHSKRAAAVYQNLAGALVRGTPAVEIEVVMRRASPSSYIRKNVPPVLLAVDDAALFQIDQQHLSRLQAPLLEDLFLGDVGHTDLG